MKKVIIVAGPTASGKTKYAMEMAEAISGEIINCDSLQIYDELKILTAHPTAEEKAKINHKLFGYLKYNQKSTAVDWACLAAREIENTWKVGKIPIIVGGTGLYIDTLVNGISPMPQISSSTRSKVTEFAKTDYTELCTRLYASVPDIKELIKPMQHHQVIRAYETFLETGKSVLYFRSLPQKKFLKNVKYECKIMKCDNETLYRRVNERFEMMLKNGAIEEVEQLLKKLDNNNDITSAFSNYHIFNAIGAKEIAMYLHDTISFDEMKETAKKNLRHYAKRQITWFKHRHYTST
jgi:tRNA dimethylallyltransferase